MLGAARNRRAAHPRTALLRTAGASRRCAARRAASRSVEVLLIALGLLIAQGPVVLHLLLVQHAACEHGEMVEVSGAHRAARTGGDRETTAARTDGSTTASDAPADRPGHDHCDALAVRHQLPEAAPAVAAASLVWIALDTGGGDRAEQRAVPILSLAPKGSPPAA